MPVFATEVRAARLPVPPLVHRPHVPGGRATQLLHTGLVLGRALRDWPVLRPDAQHPAPLAVPRNAAHPERAAQPGYTRFAHADKSLSSPGALPPRGTGSGADGPTPYTPGPAPDSADTATTRHYSLLDQQETPR